MAQRGRPRVERDPTERIPMSTRIRGDLFNKLSEAAERHDRPLGNELELIVEASFRDATFLDQAMALAYGPAAAVALAVIGRAVVEINRNVPQPKTWIDRPDMVEEAAWTAATVFAAFGLQDGPLADVLISGQGVPNPTTGGFRVIVAPSIVFRLLSAVKNPKMAGGAELREWAKPLRATLGDELAAKLRVWEWIETVNIEHGSQVVHHPADPPGDKP